MADAMIDAALREAQAQAPREAQSEPARTTRR
jgi:hypothetical protein